MMKKCIMILNTISAMREPGHVAPGRGKERQQHKPLEPPQHRQKLHGLQYLVDCLHTDLLCAGHVWVSDIESVGDPHSSSTACSGQFLS